MVNADVPVLQPHVKDGRVKAIVIYDTQRSPHRPTYPARRRPPAGATDEQLVRRAGAAATPLATRQRLEQAFAKVIAKPELARKLADAGLSGPLGAADFRPSSTPTGPLVPMIRQAGIRTE